jgi:hypothetical protein
MANNIERAGSNLPAPKSSFVSRVVVFCSKPRAVAAGAAVGFLTSDIGAHLIPIIGGTISRPAEIVGVATGAYASNRVRKAAKAKRKQFGLDG